MSVINRANAYKITKPKLIIGIWVLIYLERTIYELHSHEPISNRNLIVNDCSQF